MFSAFLTVSDWNRPSLEYQKLEDKIRQEAREQQDHPIRWAAKHPWQLLKRLVFDTMGGK